MTSKARALFRERAEHLRLREQLQGELRTAYDDIIAGWARALDRREQQAEGHTVRAAALTVRLGRALGLEEEVLAHLRRGALLHDIGTMLIPDTILLKPGPLTEQEWEAIQRHPIYAYEILSPITQFRPALDIPYCHHEKWDGSGYPRRLAGEQIPVAARIYSVVDVWDALCSERPYRAAWTPDEAQEYLCDHAGRDFDPGTVEAFITMDRESPS
ncbi:MAG TPA: HD-GYP domain-containing protein [bacterium]|nr:HD-GYP domain-containing protein [bacterium]